MYQDTENLNQIPQYNSAELTSLDSRELYSEIERIRALATRKGTEWAEKHKRYKDLKELMPSFLAEITLQEAEKSGHSSQNKVRALASEEYQEKVREQNEAERRARLLEVEYKGLLKSLDALTSVGYVRNSELRLGR